MWGDVAKRQRGPGPKGSRRSGWGRELAIARNISGGRRVLSLRPCGATSLAEGGRGAYPFQPKKRLTNGENPAIIRLFAYTRRDAMPLLDQDLPARAQQGDENALAALIARMMPAIRKGAAECTAPGLDFDDAVQEGLIGLFHAVRGFDPAAGQTFTAYAAACIRHAQQDARRAALRKKHAPLNYSVPLPAAEESTDTRPGPEELAIFGEQYADTLRRMQTELSALERTVLMAGLEGRTPAQTARELGLPAKNVANALARARRKLRGAPTT